MSKKIDSDTAIDIAEELHASRKFLRSVFDSIPGMIYVHDLENDVNLYRSWSLKRVLGYPESRLLNSGKGIRSLVHQDDALEFKQAAANLQKAEDNECVRFTYRMRHKNGSWVWFRSEEYVFERNSDGKPIKCLGYATDLTSTVEQQQQLNDINKLNELLLSAAQILSRPDTAPVQTLQDLAEVLSKHFKAVCDISVLDSRSNVIVPQALYHEDNEIREIIARLFASKEVMKGQGLVGKVIDSGKEVVIEKVPDSMKHGPASVDERIIPESLIYFPLNGSKSILGSLNLSRLKGQRPFSPDEIDQIRRMGEYLSLFIENVLLREEQKEVAQIKAEAERTLAEEKRWAEFKLETSSLLANVDLDLHVILQQLCERITEYFDVVSDVQLLDESRGMIELVALHHYDRKVKAAIEQTLAKRELAIGQGMVGGVVQTGNEFFVDKLPPNLAEKSKKEGVNPLIIPCSFAYLPLKFNNRVLGTLDLTRLSEQQPISENELSQMRDLAEHAAKFIENRLLQIAQEKEINLRKRAEQKLARSGRMLERMEAETRAMLNAIPIYISRISKDLRYMFMNDFYHSMNIDPRSMEGRFLTDVLGTQGVEKLQPYFDRALAGELVNYEHDGVMADGKHHYFTVALAPDYGESGEVVGFYSCATDVTEKVLAELESQLTQDRFETLSLNSGDAFFFHDQEQNIMDVNQVATEMLGYTREELLSMRAEQIDPRWNGEAYQKYLNKVKLNDPQTFETEIITKSGESIPVEVRFVKREEGGRIYIQSLLRDRTEKRRQEELLQQSEERLRLIFENVEDFIATVDANGVFESINKTGQGMRQEDVVGVSTIYDYYDNEEQLKELKVNFERLKTAGRSFELEDTFTADDRSTITYNRRYIPIMLDGKFLRCLLIIRDVTAERNRERSVMQAVLKGQEQERKRLGAELHDGIGQVLSAIALQVSRAKESAEMSRFEGMMSELSNLKDNLHAAIKEVRNISHDLMPDVLESFGLQEAIKQTCNNLKDRAGIDVTFAHFDLEERYDPAVELNLFRIAQELLNNIHKHARCAKVHVSLIDHGDLISLTVEDDGVGFDSKNEWSGIGLRNIRSRVNMMQGELDIESSENSGTLINIEIPKNTQ
ncbi:MAG: PAS domain S-box protein [Flavobacteriales bacterium]|nr:PAS domain S-box protein [Flavobacteriales bacterium]MCB9204773.1 PAS domain S-box protein [Flavobacteriales bacterium]